MSADYAATLGGGCVVCKIRRSCRTDAQYIHKNHETKTEQNITVATPKLKNACSSLYDRLTILPHRRQQHRLDLRPAHGCRRRRNQESQVAGNCISIIMYRNYTDEHIL